MCKVSSLQGYPGVTHQVHIRVLHDHVEELGARNFSVLIAGFAEIDFDLKPHKLMPMW